MGVEKFKKSILNREDYEEFLLMLYFGSNKDYINNCIDKAYLDFNRTLHGFSKVKNRDMLHTNARTYIKDKFIGLKSNIDRFNSQSIFDKWHEYFCFELKSIYKEYGFNDFSIGQAQKWVNMTFKYIYIYGNKISGFEKVYEFCHIPIDNIILSKLPKYFHFGVRWSRINDYQDYLEFQKSIRDFIGDEIPLDYEFELFMSRD